MDFSYMEGAAKISGNVGQLEKANLNERRKKFILLNLRVDDGRDTVLCRVNDIFTSAIRSKASRAFVSTLPPRLIVSPAVVRRYHEKRWQRGANASSASHFSKNSVQICRG